MPDAIAWDAHAHVIGDPCEFPFAPGRGYTPQPASLDDYLAMLDRYGIERGVLVQPSVYGHDHRCLLDALDRANGRLRGIAVPASDATASDLEALHDRGIRGVRCNLINPGGLSPAVVHNWQPALRALDWHVELHVSVDQFPNWADLIRMFEIPVVLDHMGRPTPGHLDPRSPQLAQAIQFVREGRCSVKLSAPYRLTNQAAPWPEVTPLASAFLAANAAACLWGTDWPHVDTLHLIDTRDVIAALDDWRGPTGAASEASG